MVSVCRVTILPFLQANPLPVQVEPLLQSAEPRKRRDVRLPFVYVENFNEKEETTCIESSMLIKESCLKRWIVVPFLSLVTVLIFPVYLYWRPKLRRDWLYSRASSVRTASHIYIEGRGKCFCKLISFLALNDHMI